MADYVPAATLEEDFVNLVRLELNDIKNTFFRIGFRLSEAQNCCYYKKLGFDTIEECAEALFGFKKTTTYDLIGIAQKFCDPAFPMQLAKEYQKFNQSQLVLFSQVRFMQKDFIRLASPDDSIAKLKKAKKYWNGCVISGARSNSKSIDEFIEKCDAYKVKHCSLSDKDFKTLDSIINHKVKASEKELSDADFHSENSGCPENNEIGPKVYDVSSENYIEVFNLSKDLKKKLISDVSNYYKHMCYKTIFDPDDKGLGIRVLPEDIVLTILDFFFSSAKEQNINYSSLERWSEVPNV